MRLTTRRHNLKLQGSGLGLLGQPVDQAAGYIESLDPMEAHRTKECYV